MPPVIKTRRAQRDVHNLLAFVQERNLGAATRLAVQLDKRFEFLGSFPYAGEECDELAPGLRSFIQGNYVIFYTVDAGAVSIVHVLHGRQDAERIFAEERGGD
jgi:toxin ParE1/3/4